MELNTDMIAVEVPHTGAYNAIRPHVKKQIQEKKYDLIIDLHRDSRSGYNNNCVQ